MDQHNVYVEVCDRDGYVLDTFITSGHEITVAQSIRDLCHSSGVKLYPYTESLDAVAPDQFADRISMLQCMESRVA